MCSGVTCLLHFWQNDQGLLCATAATWGWNKYQIRVSTQLILKKNILPLPLPGFEPPTFWSWVQCSSSKLSQTTMCNWQSSWTELSLKITLNIYQRWSWKKGWPLGRGSLTWKYEGQSWQTFSRLKCNKSDFKHNIWILSVMHMFGWANRSCIHNNVHTDITDREANAAYIMPRPSEDSILHKYLSVMFHSDHLLLCNDVRVSGSFCWRPRAHFHQPSPSVWQQRTNWRTETTTHQEVTH